MGEASTVVVDRAKVVWGGPPCLFWTETELPVGG